MMPGKATKLLFFIALLGAGTPAMAQTCDIVVEEITRLRPPAFQTYTVWDEIYGKDGMEQFSDIIPLADGTVVAAGAYTADEKDSIYKPLLVNINAKGEVIWETREESKTFKSINRIIPFAKGYAVLGDLNEPSNGDGIYVALYDDKGKRLNQWTVFEKGANLDGKAIVASADGKSLMVAAQFNPGGGTAGQYGVLYKFSSAGKRVWRHGYSPGTRSVFHNLSAAKRGGYIVSGEVEVADGRMGGWLIRVDDNGAIMWQRSYTRGDYAGFLSGTSADGDSFIMVGQVKPTGGAHTSGWIMKVGGKGDVIWQRYYAGGYNYAMRDIMIYDDGRSAALLAGVPKAIADRTHVRLMTFSPRGYLMNVEEFTEAQGAQTYTLREGFQGERIMGGYTQIKYAEGATSNGIPINTYDGWLVAAPALDPYEDPCLPKSYLP